MARWCYRFTGGRDSATDLAQEVFLKAHRSLATYRGQARFSTWLYTIARNESMSWRRRLATLPVVDDEDGLAEVPAVTPDPEATAIAGSRRDRVHEILADVLDDEERTVFTLHYGDDMPLDAITRLLGLTNASGAKAYIVSAQQKLARAAGRLQARGETI